MFIGTFTIKELIRELQNNYGKITRKVILLNKEINTEIGINKIKIQINYFRFGQEKINKQVELSLSNFFKLDKPLYFETFLDYIKDEFERILRYILAEIIEEETGAYSKKILKKYINENTINTFLNNFYDLKFNVFMQEKDLYKYNNSYAYNDYFKRKTSGDNIFNIKEPTDFCELEAFYNIDYNDIIIKAEERNSKDNE